MVTTMQQMADKASKRESAFRPGGGLSVDGDIPEVVPDDTHADTGADTESV